jgi:spermidine/putrescine-binding protein
MPLSMAGHMIAAALKKCGVKNVERPKDFKAALDLLKQIRENKVQ